MEAKTQDKAFATFPPVSAHPLATPTPCAHLAKIVKLMEPAEPVKETTTAEFSMEERSLENLSAKEEVSADLAHLTPTANPELSLTAALTDNVTTALTLETLAELKTVLLLESEPTKNVAIPKSVCV